MEHTVHVCANGLTALLTPRRHLPVVSVQVWVRTGSIHEQEFLGAGISHLLEHMVFKGTQEYSGRQLGERVPELGGSWNAYTSTDRTVYHIEGPSAHWREFLHLLTQLVFFPTFPEDEFERERDVIRREMSMYDDDPQDAAYRALVNTLYKIHPRRLPVIGNRAAFDALTHADMVAYHRRRYTPGNVFVVVAGDVDAADFGSAVEAELGALAAAPCVDVPLPQEPRQWGPRLHRCEFAQPTSTLMLGWRVPHSNHPDAAPLAMLASILNNGRSAWLYRHFHDELGLAHDISVVSFPERSGESTLVLEADVDVENRDRLRDAILEWMRELPKADFEAARRRACRQMLTARLRSLASVQGLAAGLGMAWHLTRNGHCPEEWDAALQRVSAADISRVAEAYLCNPDRLVEVSVDPEGSHAKSEDAAAAGGMEPPQEHVLPNGLRVVVRRDAALPMVHATLAVRAGAPTETAQTAGINSLLSECILKGTTSRTAQQLAEEMEDLGGAISGSAGNNTITLSSRSLAADADAMMALLADAALHPIFPQEAVETEKKAMLADVLDAQEDPAAVAFRRLRIMCYGEVSYGNHRDGTEKSIPLLSREALLAHHARIMCAGNAVLALAGDMEPEQMLQLAAAHFGSMPVGVAVQGVPTPPQQPGDETLALGKEQAVLVVAMPALTATSAELPQQLIFEEWCRDMSGPIFDEIREKRGLAYYAAATSLLGMDRGNLCFYLGTAPERVEEARAALCEVLERLAEQAMPAEALERTRATALAGRLLSLQSCGKQCSSMAVNTLLGSGADYNDRLPELIRAITPQHMQSFIRRVLAPNAVRTWITVK